MEFDDLRTYCLSKPGTEETLPFDENTLVFKVMGKMFALTNVQNAVSVNLKCKPELAIEQRAQYPDDVLPGYHMSKTHWNTVLLKGGLKTTQIETMIDHSYEQVVLGLKKADKEALKKLGEL